MAQLKFGSAGVTSREIDISGPVSQQPSGIPAGVVGTSMKGPAFVPVTVGNYLTGTQSSDQPMARNLVL